METYLFDERAETWNLLDSLLDGLNDVVSEREDLPERSVQLLRTHTVRSTIGSSRTNFFDTLHFVVEGGRRRAGDLEEQISQRVGGSSVARLGSCLESIGQ